MRPTQTEQTEWTEDGFSLDYWRRICDLKLRGQPFPETFASYYEDLTIRAAKKFSIPEDWIWTRKLLQQASDQGVAELMASYFPVDRPAWDVCCGAGSDSVALAKRTVVKAVDASPLAALLAETNLKVHGKRSSTPANEHQVLCTSAQEIIPCAEDWVHLDPDRRTADERKTHAMYLQPDWQTCLRLIKLSAGGSIKLAPATRMHDLPPEDLDQLSLGIQFISSRRTVKQQRWWWNCNAFPVNTITLSTQNNQSPLRPWSHLQFNMGASELFVKSTDYDRRADHGLNYEIIDDIGSIGAYIGDADPVVRAAGLQPALASLHQIKLVGASNGFFSCAQPRDVHSSWIDWFRVDEVMPFDRKKLRAYLREREIGVVEIKIRDCDVQPELLRKDLKLVKSGTATTILITRCNSKTIAIVASRC